MRSTILFSILSLGLLISLGSCKGKTETAPADQPATTTTTGDATTNTLPVPATTGEAHFKCTKAGCTGTGDAQGKCPICGSDLAHNPAFHNQAPGSAPATPITIDPATGKATTAPPAATNQTPPPAQNAQGVYHFACTKAGCKGGAGAAGKCPVCGSDLAHNQAYHNN